VSLHTDLLEQAQQLAQLDPRRPKPASLRRAVSSAYYGLFHLLAAEASGLYAAEPVLVARISRTLSHSEMKKASSMIASDELPKRLQSPGGGYAAPLDLKTVANAFVTLQQARHEADYDLARTFRRREVLDFVQSARDAMDAWDRVRNTDDARLYLACFQLWKRWDEAPR
jgi:hypothetical protein